MGMFAFALKKQNKTKMIVYVRNHITYHLSNLSQNDRLKELAYYLELVSKELNHLAANLQHYAGSLIFTLLIIFIVKSLQKEQNSTNLLL